MNASDVLNLLVDDYPHMAAIKTFTTGTPAISNFNVGHTNHFLVLTYTASELEQDSEYQSLDDIDRVLTRIDDKYDLIFLDPWHTLEDSVQGLQIALKFIKPNGFIVVHDCLTLEASMSATFIPGAWSGVTAIAFRDLVSILNRNWCVIDSNHGIGVIGPEYGSQAIEDLPNNPRWLTADLEEKVRIFYEDPRDLMRAIGPAQAEAAIRNLKLKANVKKLSAEYSANPARFQSGASTAEFEELRKQFEAIQNSKIWKLTAPYRAIRKSFKR